MWNDGIRMYTDMYIYIYMERERERVCASIYICIYIYTCMYIHIYKIWNICSTMEYCILQLCQTVTPCQTRSSFVVGIVIEFLKIAILG